MFLLPTMLGAQFPEGGEFQIDPSTVDNIIFVANPDTATTADGGFFTVWTSLESVGNDNLGSSILGRRYAADGTAQGAPFQVNSFTTGDQDSPAIATAPNGDVVVVWGHLGENINDPLRGIHGQRFSSDGTPLGALFQLVGANPLGPAVAMNEDGFVVTWHDDEISGQLFDSGGTLLGGEFQINTYTTGSQFFSEVAMDATGRFVVVWSSEGSAGDDDSLTSVQGRRFASDGTPLDGGFQANTYTTDNQWFPSVAMEPGGDFAVVWQNSLAAGGSEPSKIVGRRYDSNGNPLGGTFQSSSQAVESVFPDVAMRSNDTFIVVWNTNEVAGVSKIFGRLHNADGSTQGEPFQTGLQQPGFNRFSAKVAAAPAGKFVITWHNSYYASYGGNSFERIEGQRFREAFFADGFEGGDTGQWSSTVP